MSFYEEHSKPMLTEPGVKYFLNETLKQCHTFKEKHNNTLLSYHLVFPSKIKSITAREIFQKYPEVKKILWGGNFWMSGYYSNRVG